MRAESVGFSWFPSDLWLTGQHQILAKLKSLARWYMAINHAV